jgi:hypothetical protein
VSTLLDDLVPSYEVSSRHAILVAASPALVYQAAREADLGRPRLVRVLLGLRSVPASFAAAFRSHRQPAEPRHQKFVGGLGFALIAEAEGEEFVLGIMGRFWKPTGELVPAAAEQFRQPPPAGLAQALWNFRVAPAGARTRLSTETRVRCGDAATRRKFLRYWWFVRLGSGLIRGSMLRMIRSDAERRAGDLAPG